MCPKSSLRTWSHTFHGLHSADVHDIWNKYYIPFVDQELFSTFCLSILFCPYVTCMSTIKIKNKNTCYNFNQNKHGISFSSSIFNSQDFTFPKIYTSTQVMGEASIRNLHIHPKLKGSFLQGPGPSFELKKNGGYSSLCLALLDNEGGGPTPS